MRLRITLVCLAVFSVAGFAGLSLLRGQEQARPRPPLRRLSQPLPTRRRPRPRRARFLQGQRSAKGHAPQRPPRRWLFRMNTNKGRFVPGLEPSLPDVVLDGDGYLRPQASPSRWPAPRPGRRPLHRAPPRRRSSPCSTKLFSIPPPYPPPPGGRETKINPPRRGRVGWRGGCRPCTAAPSAAGQPPRGRGAAGPRHQRVARPAKRMFSKRPSSCATTSASRRGRTVRWSAPTSARTASPTTKRTAINQGSPPASPCTR